MPMKISTPFDEARLQAGAALLDSREMGRDVRSRRCDRLATCDAERGAGQQSEQWMNLACHGSISFNSNESNSLGLAASRRGAVVFRVRDHADLLAFVPGTCRFA